jgi:hypothetical protein
MRDGTLVLVQVHRLLNPLGFAAGQLAVFQGANEAPISGLIWPSENSLKYSSTTSAVGTALSLPGPAVETKVVAYTACIDLTQAGSLCYYFGLRTVGLRSERVLPARWHIHSDHGRAQSRIG